jgi:hypothetical protein
VCPSHVAPIAWGVHDFAEVANRELRRVSFEGGETVTKCNGLAVEDHTGEVAYQ